MSSSAANPSSSFTRRGLLKATAAVSAAAVVTSVGTPFVHAAGSDKLKVGLIGCGGRGRGAASDSVTSSANVQLWALGDLFPDQLEQAKKSFQEKEEKDKYNISDDRCFSGWDAYKKVIASGVDIVLLTTPPAFKPMMLEAAIEAGKHVFVEKPIAVDPAGVRRAIAAAEQAKQKNLAIVSGTQRRHQTSYIETIKRIHDGMIGELTSGSGYWMQGGLRVIPRKPEYSDVEWQIRNWWYFTWLSGDHIVEQHMHQHDVLNWIFGGPPRWANGMGGRMWRTGPEYGNVYDFFSVEYEYGNGSRALSMCRQIDGTYSRITELAVGTKGRAIADGKLFDLKGKLLWRYEPPEDENAVTNPYVLEHRDMIASIRAGSPLNEGKQTAESALTSIMGRMSAYTGKLVTWQMAMNSKLNLYPDTLNFGPKPVAAVPIPGKEELV